MVSLEWCESTRVHYQGPGLTRKRFVTRIGQGPAPKRVLIRFRDAAMQGEWREQTLSLQAELPDGARLYETAGYEGSELELFPSNTEFAVKAEFTGSSALDDNRGQNYCLASDAGPLLNIPVVLSNYSYSQGKVSGTVFLKNYAVHKRVRVFFSVDNFRSVGCVDASFTSSITTGPKDLLFFPNAYNCDAWTFLIPMEQATGSRSMCLFLEYECAGNKYYDLNYNRLFHIDMGGGV